MAQLTVGRRPDEYNQAAGLAIDIVNGGPQSYDDELVIMCLDILVMYQKT